MNNRIFTNNWHRIIPGYYLVCKFRSVINRQICMLTYNNILHPLFFILSIYFSNLKPKSCAIKDENINFFFASFSQTIKNNFGVKFDKWIDNIKIDVVYFRSHAPLIMHKIVHYDRIFQKFIYSSPLIIKNEIKIQTKNLFFKDLVIPYLHKSQHKNMHIQTLIAYGLIMPLETSPSLYQLCLGKCCRSPLS